MPTNLNPLPNWNAEPKPVMTVRVLECAGKILQQLEDEVNKPTRSALGLDVLWLAIPHASMEANPTWAQNECDAFNDYLGQWKAHMAREIEARNRNKEGGVCMEN